jgi:hypothetical protein
MWICRKDGVVSSSTLSNAAGALAVAALCLLAACRSEPLATPPPDPDSVLRAVVWHGAVPVRIEPSAPGSAEPYHLSGQHAPVEATREFHGLRLLYQMHHRGPPSAEPGTTPAAAGARPAPIPRNDQSDSDEEAAP